MRFLENPIPGVDDMKPKKTKIKQRKRKNPNPYMM